MGLKPRTRKRAQVGTGASDRAALVEQLIRSFGPTVVKGARPSTTIALAKQHGIGFGPEMTGLADALCGKRAGNGLELFRPQILSLTQILAVEQDFVIGYLGAFFAGATPFANMYHDDLYSVSWAHGASGNQSVCGWDWEEGWGRHEAPSVASFLHKRLIENDEDNGDHPALPASASKAAKLPAYLDSPNLWTRSNWLVRALQHAGYGEEWTYSAVATAADYRKEVRHLDTWPHLVGHWLWWSFFFEDESKIQTCLQAAGKHAHPFVRESSKLIKSYRAGKVAALEAIVSVDETRDTLREHCSDRFSKSAIKAQASRAAQTGRKGADARKILAAHADGDAVFNTLTELVGDKTFDFKWVAGVDFSVCRDREDLGDAPHVEHHFSPDSITRERYEQVQSVRRAVGPEHRPVLVDVLTALAQAKRHRPASGLVVDLIGHTCTSYDELVATVTPAIGRSPTADMAAELTYACRRFSSAAARKRMVQSARAFVSACHGGKLPSPRGFTGLYQTDIKENAQLLRQFIDECANYTLGDWPWRGVVAALRRVRALKHGGLCASACRKAIELRTHDYGADQALMSLLSVDPTPERHKSFLTEQYETSLTWPSSKGEYRPAQHGLRLAGALYFQPKKTAYREAAAEVIDYYVQRKKDIRADYVAAINGIAMVVEAQGIRALHPVLKRTLKWQPKPYGYDVPATATERALELLRLRVARFVG